jgi:hypothetical protein
VRQACPTRRSLYQAWGESEALQPRRVRQACPTRRSLYQAWGKSEALQPRRVRQACPTRRSLYQAWGKSEALLLNSSGKVSSSSRAHRCCGDKYIMVTGERYQRFEQLGLKHETPAYPSSRIVADASLRHIPLCKPGLSGSYSCRDASVPNSLDDLRYTGGGVFGNEDAWITAIISMSTNCGCVACVQIMRADYHSCRCSF